MISPIPSANISEIDGDNDSVDSIEKAPLVVEDSPTHVSYPYTVHGSGLAPMALGLGWPNHPRAKGWASSCVALTLFGRAKGPV